MSVSSSSNEDLDMMSVESDSSTSSEGSKMRKLDIMFEHCHWYDIPCPYPQCYANNIRFDCHDKFKLHHEQCHCPRGVNGDINRAKDSLRWRCPVLISTVVDGKEIKIQCSKISNSWYNYAGHITSHKEIGHGWGCALKPAGKRKKTNLKRLVRDHKSGAMVKMTVCGKRTSTKHHLLAHMANVHKTFNVIDTNGRQYHKKKKTSNRTRNRSVIGKKRKFREIEHKKAVNNESSTSLLQMPLPSFQSLQSIPMPQFPNLFASKHNQLPLLINNLLPIQSYYPQLHGLNVSDHQGKQCMHQNEQFDFLKLLCKAAHAHKGCLKCCDYVEDEMIEASLPSLSTYNGSIHSQSSNVSPSGSISDDTSTTTNNVSVTKLPQLPSTTIFPNLPSQTITKNVPFTFDLNQLQCSSNSRANNGTAFLEQNVITTAIPSLPVFTQNFN